MQNVTEEHHFYCSFLFEIVKFIVWLLVKLRKYKYLDNILVI